MDNPLDSIINTRQIVAVIVFFISIGFLLAAAGLSFALRKARYQDLASSGVTGIVALVFAGIGLLGMTLSVFAQNIVGAFIRTGG